MVSYFFQILDGLELTLTVFFFSLLLSFPLGMVVAVLRLSKIKVVSWLTGVYIWIFRGTPLLLQLIFVFFGLPLYGLTLGRTESVVLAFTLNYAAYFGEIFRSGIQSIEKGQREAAEILGFTPVQVNRKIILPQVIKRTLPSIGNEVITLIKDTSLVYAVGLNDVLKYTRGIVARDAVMSPFLIAAMFYLVLTYVLTKVFEQIEARVYYEE